MNRPTVNASRLLQDLQTLASFGRYRTGVHRPSLSPQDIVARQWFASRLEQAGLPATIDGIGNVIGRKPAGGTRLLAGSHLETVPFGGWLDGALGCIIALEAARVLYASEKPLRHNLDVAAFFDEEGHFGSFLGSRSFIGELDDAEIWKAASIHDGSPLRDALATAGWSGRPRITMIDAEYIGYLEAHIEQGAVLESLGHSLGVVSAIVGTRQYRITAAGEQNHAGTTPMRFRKDAGVALVRLLHEIDDHFPGVVGDATVWTVGRIVLHPGSPSIVPGRAEAILEIRDSSDAVLRGLDAALRNIIRQARGNTGCSLDVELLRQSQPVRMDEKLRSILHGAAERACGGVSILPSGATHDARIIARRIPAAMLFVKSIGGISHDVREDTPEEDIILAAEAFTDAVMEICCEQL